MTTIRILKRDQENRSTSLKQVVAPGNTSSYVLINADEHARKCTVSQYDKNNLNNCI